MTFDSDRLSHAYIVSADATADVLAMAVVCSTRDNARPCRKCIHCDKASRRIHPDITVVGKLDDKLIVSVDQIRELKKDVYIVPNDSMQKAYIVNDAEKMNVNAQNAFLQILEEPPAHAVFILCTENPSALLPTVRSRCVELKPQPTVKTAETAKDSESKDGKSKDSESKDSESKDSKSKDSESKDSESKDSESKGSKSGDSIEEQSDTATLEEFVHEFIAALPDNNVKLMKCMFRLDKFDRITFNDFLVLAREHLVLSLRKNQKLHENTKTDNAATQKALLHADTVLIKAGEMLSLNVSTGHISGFICASLVKIET